MFSWKKDKKRVFMDKRGKEHHKKAYLSFARCTTGIGLTIIEFKYMAPQKRNL